MVPGVLGRQVLGVDAGDGAQDGLFRQPAIGLREADFSDAVGLGAIVPAGKDAEVVGGLLGGALVLSGALLQCGERVVQS